MLPFRGCYSTLSLSPPSSPLSVSSKNEEVTCFCGYQPAYKMSKSSSQRGAPSVGEHLIIDFPAPHVLQLTLNRPKQMNSMTKVCPICVLQLSY